MTGIEHIKRSDFDYDLPNQRIAKYPLANRDESKLLVFKEQQTEISQFKNIKDYLGQDDLLIFNNAKVIPARLYFKRETGATIEILLLEPHNPANYEEIFNEHHLVEWNCIIGNLKKWKDNESIYLQSADLKVEAQLINREERTVRLKWEQDQKFIDVLEEIGKLPIPPYLDRDTEDSDYENYQTVFAKNDGSVAAPTAGLHFTDDLISSLSSKGINQTELTLHVGAGTFLPVKEDKVADHPMHREHFEVTLDALENLIARKDRVAVGTTSLRVLESLYYCGVQMSIGFEGSLVTKLEPYEVDSVISYEEALGYIVKHLKNRGLTTFYAATEIMILPQYRPKSIKALFTNFHLPESTLLMLISSIVGEDWREIYNTAIENDFRFLSYGDSSLLFV